MTASLELVRARRGAVHSPASVCRHFDTLGGLVLQLLLHFVSPQMCTVPNSATSTSFTALQPLFRVLTCADAHFHFLYANHYGERLSSLVSLRRRRAAARPNEPLRLEDYTVEQVRQTSPRR